MGKSISNVKFPRVNSWHPKSKEASLLKKVTFIVLERSWRSYSSKRARKIRGARTTQQD
jgi:hypothetical protein